MAYYDHSTNTVPTIIKSQMPTRSGAASHTMGTSTSSTAPRLGAFPQFQMLQPNMANFQIGMPGGGFQAGATRTFFGTAQQQAQRTTTTTTTTTTVQRGEVVSRRCVNPGTNGTTMMPQRTTYQGDVHASESTLCSTSNYHPQPVTSISASDNRQENLLQGLRRFNAFYPETATPSPDNDNKSKERQAVGHMKRGENKPAVIPGGSPVAIGLLNNKLVLRGPSECLDKLRGHPALVDLEAQNALYWIEEGPPPSGQLIALDFDKTIVTNFLWQELGGLQGANAQVRNLHNCWLRNQKLQEVAFGGLERIARLRSMIESCQKRGDIVCILSSGFGAVIREVMKFVSLNDLIPDDLVYGSDGPPFGASKSARLKRIGEMHGRPKTALVDDDKSYIAGAFRDGHSVIWVKDGMGIGEREFRLLEKGEWDDKSVWERPRSK